MNTNYQFFMKENMDKFIGRGFLKKIEGFVEAKEGFNGLIEGVGDKNERENFVFFFVKFKIILNVILFN